MLALAGLMADDFPERPVFDSFLRLTGWGQSAQAALGNGRGIKCDIYHNG